MAAKLAPRGPRSSRSTTSWPRWSRSARWAPSPSCSACCPGMGQIKDQINNLDERDVDRTAAIIKSMTPAERQDPTIINGSRRARIAKGSGVEVSAVKNLVERFFEARKMMSRMAQGGGMPGMPGMPGHGRRPRPAEEAAKQAKGKQRSGNPMKRKAARSRRPRRRARAGASRAARSVCPAGQDGTELRTARRVQEVHGLTSGPMQGAPLSAGAPAAGRPLLAGGRDARVDRRGDVRPGGSVPSRSTDRVHASARVSPMGHCRPKPVCPPAPKVQPRDQSVPHATDRQPGAPRAPRRPGRRAGRCPAAGSSLLLPRWPSI